MWFCLTGIYIGVLELGVLDMFPESYELHVITSLLTFYRTYPTYIDKNIWLWCILYYVIAHFLCELNSSHSWLSEQKYGLFL